MSCRRAGIRFFHVFLTLGSVCADKSGFIDPQELRAALTMLGVEVDFEKLKQMGVEDKDGDGELSLADLDKNNDNKIDFDEFKAIAHILPKREHAIYRGALHSDPITMPRDPTKVCVACVALLGWWLGCARRRITCPGARGSHVARMRSGCAALLSI